MSATLLTPSAAPGLSQQSSYNMNTLTSLQAPSLRITGNCSRCGKTLTDTASIESGLGPICRGLANQILAKEIPTRWDNDRVQALLFLPQDVFPAAHQERWVKVYTQIFTSKGMGTLEAYKGEDWRKTVTELVFFMSVAPSAGVVEALLGAVRGLGYERYAAYISGQSSAGEASVGFELDLLWLKGPRNKVGHYALAREAGARWNREAERWECPRAQHQAFARVVLIYWPFASGVEAAVTQARAPYLLWEKADYVMLQAPYNPAFVEALKAAVPRPERWYEPEDQTWVFEAQHKETLLTLLASHF